MLQYKSSVIYFTLTIFQEGDDYVFQVSDNGKGIKKSDIDYIFNPGFSTKFDKATGDICRGIGLTLVKDLVQDVFKGSISVKSEENIRTTFTVKIPVFLMKPERKFYEEPDME